MTDSLLMFWSRTAQQAEAAAREDDAQEMAAVRTAYDMADTIRRGQRIPLPTPELNAKLAHAEVLARQL